MIEGLATAWAEALTDADCPAVPEHAAAQGHRLLERVDHIRRRAGSDPQLLGDLARPHRAVPHDQPQRAGMVRGDPVRLQLGGPVMAQGPGRRREEVTELGVGRWRRMPVCGAAHPGNATRVDGVGS